MRVAARSEGDRLQRALDIETFERPLTNAQMETALRREPGEVRVPDEVELREGAATPELPSAQRLAQRWRDLKRE